MAPTRSSALMKWMLVGAAFQLIMVISGHYNPFIAENVFAIGGMTISLLVGAGYGFAAGASRGGGALGGLLVGGGCALLGIVVSVALGDVPAFILAVGTLSSAVTGGIGGFVAALTRSSSAPAT